jgi:hypothetical protein
MIILFKKGRNIYYFVSDLDIWMSQYELPKGRIKSETVDSIPSA